MTTLQLSLITAGLLAGGILLMVYGLSLRTNTGAVRDRLQSLGRPGKTTVTLEELELSRPFADRAIKPLLKSMSRVTARLAPGANAESITNKLNMAGNPMNLTVEMFLGLKMALAIAGAGLSLAAQFLLPPLIPVPSTQSLLLYTVLAAVSGFFLPELWLKDESRKRQKRIRKVLPDTIDVLSMSVEAGLGFDAAMSRICQKTNNPLTYEFDRYLTELRVGKSRREALRQIQARTGVDDLNTFVGAVIQADQLGVSIAKTLRIQSEQLRVKRRQRAEQLAQKAPLKMLFPMILFIFPSLFVVILGPSIPVIMGGL
jgi:tight adherence protein C